MILTAEKAIFAKLAAASGLTTLLGGTAIYNPQAPQGTVPPYVVVQKSSGVPRWTNAGTAFEDDLYIVKAIVQSTSSGLAGTIAHQIDQALTDRTLALTGYKQMLTRRVSDIDYVEDVAGKIHQHRGGIYRIQADPA